MTEPVMQGHGYYNAHSELQARSAETSDAMLARALEALAIPAAGPIYLADFGASQGYNSMRPIGQALAALERRAPGREFMVLHTDLPGSDFSSLFRLLEESPESYRIGRPQVSAAAAGRSFYERLLPAGVLQLGWSAFALHWMSALPVRPRGHIWLRFASAEEDAALTAASAADWRRFLEHRAVELAPGGQLVLVVGAVDAAGQTGLEPLMALAEAVLRRMAAERLIEPDALAAMTIPTRPRRLAEFEAPFATLEALRLEELVLAETPNAAMLRWQETGDAAAFGAAMAGFFIAAFGPSLFGDDQALDDAFASRLARAVADEAATVARPLVTATLRIARR